jgi:hypothetical protein
MLTSITNPSHSRTIDLFMTQNGSKLTGPRAYLGIPLGPNSCDFFGTMSGTANGSQVTMDVVIPANPPIVSENVILAGTFNDNTISGTYTDSGCHNGESGTFQISPAPSITSSQWSGTWAGPHGSGGSAAANLVEDSSANVTGTLTLGGGACDGFGTGPENVTGSLIGLWIDMIANAPGGQWETGGHFDLVGKSVNLVHVCNSGPLPGGVMTVFFTRP